MNEPTTTRTRVITTILERYTELVDPMNGPGAIKGDGDSITGMPRTYTATVREVERLLREMRNSHNPLLRRLWWNVNARYITATTRTVDEAVTRKAKNGKRLQVVERRVVSVYDRRVDEQLVTLAVKWLAQQWGLKSEPMVPRELQVAA